MKRHAILALKVCLAIGLIVWLVTSGKLDFAKLRDVGDRWPWWLTAWAIFGGVVFLSAVRWHILLRAQNIHYSVRDTYALSLVGLFFSQVMLGSTGGDMVKAYIVIAEQKGRRSAGVVSVVFDRVFGLFILLGVALVASLTNWELLRTHPDLISFAALILSMFLGVIALGWLFFSPRVRAVAWVQVIYERLPGKALLARFEQALSTYKDCPRTLFLCALVSIVMHCGVVSSSICAAKTLIDGELPIAAFFFLIPLAHIAMAVPLTPGSIGTGEAAYDYLLGCVRIEQGSLIAIVMRTVYIAWALVGCICYLRRKRKVDSAMLEVKRAEADSAAPPAPHDPDGETLEASESLSSAARPTGSA